MKTIKFSLLRFCKYVLLKIGLKHVYNSFLFSLRIVSVFAKKKIGKKQKYKSTWGYSLVQERIDIRRKKLEKTNI